MKHKILVDPARPEGRPVKKPARHPNGQPYRMPRPISRMFDTHLKEQTEAALMREWSGGSWPRPPGALSYRSRCFAG